MFIRKESDWLSNGDAKDDLEVQSELGDGDDPVVMDNGFALASGNWADNSWKANQFKGSLNEFIQLGNKARAKRESDWIANADAADDKELESEMGDGEDEIVFDGGFALAGGIWADNSYKNDQYMPSLNDFLQTKDLFLTNDFKESHPNRIPNAMFQGTTDPDTMLIQMEEMEKDHFYT